MLFKEIYPHLKGHKPEVVHVSCLGRVCSVSLARRHHPDGEIWCVGMIGARPALHRPSCRTRENVCIAKTGNVGSTVLVDQDICL